MKALLAIRACPICVDDTYVVFTSRLEEPFGLCCTPSLAAVLRGHLLEEFDIVALIERGPDERIATGELRTVVPVVPSTAEETREAWTTWYQSVNGGVGPIEDGEP